METKDLKNIENYTYGLEKIFAEAQDFLPINGTDYVEFYVGNAKQAAHYSKTALGFQSFAYQGLETGVTDRTSYVVKQDKIKLILTTPLNSESEITFLILGALRCSCSAIAWPLSCRSSTVKASRVTASPDGPATGPLSVSEHSED